jgi:hypothetical protein
MMTQPILPGEYRPPAFPMGTVDMSFELDPD